MIPTPENAAHLPGAPKIRRVSSDADLEAHVAIWNAITPRDPVTVAEVRERMERQPERLYLVAELDGRVVGSGHAGPSDSPGRGFVTPRVLPEARRRGVGTELLHALASQLETVGFETVSAHVDGRDEGSLAFARRFGFEVVDRQVEQVRTIGHERPPEIPDGLELVTIAERPELLERVYHELGAKAYGELPVSGPIEVALEDWLREEATYPEGSFVALEDGEIVGYAGLMRSGDDPSHAEDGLAVVRRDRRRQGIATLLKRAKLAWAAANGIERVVTWTQTGNEAMQAANERLGYTLESVALTVRAPLPLR